MKTWILQIIFLLATFNVYSQSKDWKQINTQHKTAVELLYQSSGGILFGLMSITKEMAISKDNGLSWVIDKSFPELNYFYSSNNVFEEDKSGKIFCFFDQIVYFFNPVNTSFVKYIELENFEYIEDIAFLHNGDMTVCTNGKFLLYSDLGILKKTQEWWTYAPVLLPSQEKNGLNYVIQFVPNNHDAAYEIWEFTGDLSFVGNKKAIDSRGSFIRKNNRIFSNTAYTDDGGTTWNKLPLSTDEYLTYFNLGHDGNFYYEIDNDVFMSADSGHTFTKMDFSFENVNGWKEDISYVSASKDGVFVLEAYGDDCIPDIYTSNQNQNLKKVNTEIGPYHVDNVYPGSNEYISIIECFVNFITKDPIKDWRKLEIGNLEYQYIEQLLYLSNGEILAVYNYRLYKSKDNAESWEKTNSNMYFDNYSNISEKNGKLYSYFSDSIYYSNDFGETWESEQVDVNLFNSNRNYIQYSDQSDIFYVDPTSGNFEKYNITTHLTKPVNFSGDTWYGSFTTSFDGKTLYILNFVQPNKLSLYVSNDYGVTFSFKQLDLPINGTQYFLKVDHIGNLYIFTDKLVQMSSDDGQNWVNITPDFPELVSINDLNVSYDNYIYLATTGMGILKYKPQLATPKGLKVIVYDDLNKNCQKDNGEPSVPIGKVVVNDLYVRELDDNGEALFKLHTIQNKVSLDINESLYESCQEFYDVTLDDDYTELSIPLKAKKYCADVEASISAPFLRRCFDNTYYGQVCNNGNIEAENVVTKVKLDPYFDLKETSVPIVSHIGDELVLDIKSLKAGECTSFSIKINLSCDAALGQEHCMEIDATSSTKNCNEITSRVTYLDCQENVGSYDPNDKSIFVNGVKNKEYVEQGDKVEYMIRFQNTGNDTAFTVKIQDPISSKFDVSSIVPVAASHEYTWSVENGVLNVTFENIMLVDSFKNEPLSHGFIKFEIALNRSTERNQDVSNLAGIFFDFNEPVITNEVITPVGKPVSTYDPDENPISLYPNPTNDIIHITSSNTSFKDAQIIIYNESGKIAMTTGLQAGSNRYIDVSGLPSGFYIIKVIGDKAAYKAKFVKL
jgi:uncharacterized repeat protein (TIGR01451 family)